MKLYSKATTITLCILLAAGFLEEVTAVTDSQQPQIQVEDRFFCCSFVRSQCVNKCAGVDCSLPCYGSCGLFNLFSCGPIQCGDVAPNTCIKSSSTTTSTTTTSTTTTNTTTTKWDKLCGYENTYLCFIIIFIKS